MPQGWHEYLISQLDSAIFFFFSSPLFGVRCTAFISGSQVNVAFFLRKVGNFFFLTRHPPTAPNKAQKILCQLGISTRVIDRSNKKKKYQDQLAKTTAPT